ncbi:MAG: sigma-70 family RNA polymerase sigma factor, partial [Verrucomicrobiota bacterium]
VAQQANSTIWRKRSDFEIGTQFKAWIFSIARFEVLNHRKRLARDHRLVFSEELEEIIADEVPALANDLDDRQTALQHCLKRLKPAEQDLILNRYFKNTPIKEYASQTGRSAGGLKVTLHRLRNKLQTCIESRLQLKEVSQ